MGTDLGRQRQRAGEGAASGPFVACARSYRARAKARPDPSAPAGNFEAIGDLLVFVDDDNVLDLWTTWRPPREYQRMPFLGSWSGQCRPEFEQPPPEWTRRYWGNLVVREFDQDVGSRSSRLTETMPCGAGLCVRRAVAHQYLHLHDSGKRSMLLDRVGNSLMSGGDNDLAACACDLGLGVGLIAALKLMHLIPPERLTVEYLTRLAEGIAHSSTVLDAERGVVASQRTMLGRAVDLLRLMRLPNPHRRIVGAAYRGRNRALKRAALGN